MAANSPSVPLDTSAAGRQPGSPWSIAEAAEHLGLCRATVERACRAGRIRATKFGRRVVIAGTELERIVREGF